MGLLSQAVSRVGNTEKESVVLMARRAALKQCRQCNEYVVAGHDRDAAAIPVVVDPVPVSKEQAAALHSLGWQIYSLAEDGELWGSVGSQMVKRLTYESSHIEHRCVQAIPKP